MSKSKVYWSDCSKCGWHRPKKLNYVQWHEWADRKAQQGEKQRQCPTCLCWFFDEEYGQEPEETP